MNPAKPKDSQRLFNLERNKGSIKTDPEAVERHKQIEDLEYQRELRQIDREHR